jgi:hypothetical protein
MRTIRTVAAGLACTALLPAVALAQNGRLFEDAWFWGAKGGVSLLKANAGNVTAPLVGAEWLITRSRTGLYVSIDQSFFDTRGSVYDPTVAGAARAVDISDMRRYSIALMGFPKRYGVFRPYIGAGFAVNVLQTTTPNGTFASAGAMDTLLARVDDQGSRSSVMFMGGVQAQYSRFSLFAQGTLMPTRRRFLINGSANTTVIEGGIRYNLTGAREKF